MPMQVPWSVKHAMNHVRLWTTHFVCASNGDERASERGAKPR